MTVKGLYETVSDLLPSAGTKSVGLHVDAKHGNVLRGRQDRRRMSPTFMLGVSNTAAASFVSSATTAAYSSSSFG